MITPIPSKLALHRAKLLYTFSHPDNVYKLYISPDGKYLVTINYGVPKAKRQNIAVAANHPPSTVNIGDLRTGKRLYRLFISETVRSVCISPNSKTLVILGEIDNQVKRTVHIQIRDLTTGHLRHVLSHFPSEGEGLAFSPNGKFLAIGDSINDAEKGEVVKVYDTKRWKLCDQFFGFESGHMCDVAFSSDNTLVAGVSVAGEVGLGEMAIWNIRTKKRVRYLADEDSLENTTNDIHEPLFFFDKNQQIIVGESATRLRSKSSRARHIATDENLVTVGHSPQTLLVLMANRKTGLIELWNTRTHQCRRRWKLAQYQHQVNPEIQLARSASPDGKFYASVVASKTVNVWRLK